MGKKTKVGKARRDKFYHLAKETGYRSRAAFKLIQLNRKFGFLEKSRVCIDLCAAPGGWCQVAANYMPISSVIIGVDLVPIRAIPKVTTLVDDITTEKCRQDLKKELKDWKADIVLNDGAPNVGQNWLQDAFSQAGLVLHSMKLASEFLRKGGWFVTKVFRSQDYHALLWVFNQLFNKVHATKPQASRNESAEIFIVCQGYKAPDKLDPKFLDPKAVFKDVSDEPSNSINLIHPSKKKKKAEGYEEGDYTQHKTLPVSMFLSQPNFLDRLAAASEIVFDDVSLLKHPSTTKEILECCKDIKILGKADIRMLLTWRKKVVASTTDQNEKVAEETKEEEAAEGSDSENVDQQIERLRAESMQEEKRKKRKAGKIKQKLKEKMSLNMVKPGDCIVQQDDENLFDLQNMKTKSQLERVGSPVGDDGFSDPADSGDDSNVGQKVYIYDRTEEQLAWESESQSSASEDDNLSENLGGDVDGDVEEEAVSEGEETPNPLITDLGAKQAMHDKKAAQWFSKGVFEDIDVDADEDYDMGLMISDYKQRGGKVKGAEDVDPHVQQKITTLKPKPPQKRQRGSKSDSDDDDDEDTSSDSDTDSDDSTYAKLYDKQKYENGKVVESKDLEVVKPGVKLDAVGLAIGAKMMHSKKAKRQMMDDTYNRYAFHDDQLPDWFAKEEARHLIRHPPVTKAEVEEYKQRMRAIDARPIKKVAEARGRKKKKMMKRLEKARKKAEAIFEDGAEAGPSDREKWNQIKSIYKKATMQKKESVTYVVAKRGAGKRVSRPAGVKGRFKVVDPRMKKDMRSVKAHEKKTRGKKGKVGKGRKKG